MHSHNYRTPEDFKSKRVLCLGAAASGQDIAIDLSSKAEMVRLNVYVLLKKKVCFFTAMENPNYQVLVSIFCSTKQTVGVHSLVMMLVYIRVLLLSQAMSTTHSFLGPAGSNPRQDLLRKSQAKFWSTEPVKAYAQ